VDTATNLSNYRRQHPQSIHNDLLTNLLKEDTLSEEVITDLKLFLLFAAQKKL